MDSTSLLSKIPPQNMEAEQSTLGSMMIDGNALEKGVEILKPEDFYREAHQTIFDSLMSLAERNEPVDIITVQEELRNNGRLDSIGGTEYLMALIDAVPTAANIEYYAHIVEEKALLRRLIDACTQINGWCHGQVDEADSLVDQAERLIFQISQKRMGDYFTPLSILAHEAFERIETQYKDKRDVSGQTTGFKDLDKITSGLQSSDFIIVAARPSMGKTAFVLDIARHIAVQEKKPVALFSLEMSKEQLAVRLICSQSKVDAQRLRSGYIQNDEWVKLADGVGKLYAAPIFIDDNTGTTSLQMRAKCRRLKAEHGLSLIVIDYLQLMSGSRRTENRVQEIGEIARSLKGLARELNVPVIALSQLSRSVEQRPDKRPMLSDLRESGSIEAEADVVAFIYRDAYYKQKEIILDDEGSPVDLMTGQDALKIDNTAEIIIGKQRNGPTGLIKLAFISKFACFENLAETYRGEPE
ncbi:MAG: replicative DNA helicase [Armatimonadota bacterium]